MSMISGAYNIWLVHGQLMQLIVFNTTLSLFFAFSTSFTDWTPEYWNWNQTFALLVNQKQKKKMFLYFSSHSWWELKLGLFLSYMSWSRRPPQKKGTLTEKIISSAGGLQSIEHFFFKFCISPDGTLMSKSCHCLNYWEQGTEWQRVKYP